MLKKKLKLNIHTSPDVLNVPNLRQKRSASKTEDPKLNGTLSTVKSSRKTVSNALNIGNLVKKKITVPNTIIVAKTNLNKGLAAVGKKNSKALSKIGGTRLTKTTTQTETVTK